MSIFEEIRESINEANRTLKVADQATDEMICIVQGRLRSVHTWMGHDALVAIKKELKNYDARKRQWKDGNNG